MIGTATATPTSCIAMNIGADADAIPANESLSMRATVTAGLAKLVDDVNQYAPVIQAATANATIEPRPERTMPLITNATISQRPTTRSRPLGAAGLAVGLALGM